MFGLKNRKKDMFVRSAMTEVELTADEWKIVLKWIGKAFHGATKDMSNADKRLFMKIQVITSEEIEFEKMDEDDDIDV